MIHLEGKVQSYLILWLGTNEYEWRPSQTIEDVIEYVKVNDKYCNYGRRGAMVVRADLFYQILDIDDDGHETRFVE